MSLNCVHGIPPTHCARCRTCPHGLTTSACGRCANAVTSRAAAKALPAPLPAEEHRGYEVFFVPQDRSWYYRDEPTAPVSGSYRSAFQAKRAINATLDDPPTPPKPKSAPSRTKG